MTPEITVVMATYRQHKYIKQAIDSVLAQSVPLRLNVVTTMQGDWTGVDMVKDYFNAIRQSYPQHWLVTFWAEHRGIWIQRMDGLHRQPYPYVCFFDSDDVMLPGWLEKGLKVAKEISSRGKIPIVGPSYRMVDEKLRPLQEVILPEFSMDRMMEGSIIPDFSITKTENLRVAFEAGCKVAREMFTPQYSCYCSWLEMLKRFDCEVKLLPDIGFLYRQHKGGMHNRFKRSKRASRKNVEMVRKIARNYFPELGDRK